MYTHSHLYCWMRWKVPVLDISLYRSFLVFSTGPADSFSWYFRLPPTS